MNPGNDHADPQPGSPTLRTVFRWLSALLFVAVVVQVGLAGYGAFHAVHAADHTSISKKTIDNAFNPHIALGYIIVLVMLALLLVALAGRLGKRAVLSSGVIVLLGIAQAILGMASESTPAIGPLHTINALAIFAASGALTHRSWPRRRSETPAATA
jgi:small-conductance mechanosensitive channel